MSLTREHLSLEIIEAGRFLYARGWSPATSSNYSTRLSASQALLTVSGKHKGQLGPDDVLATDLAGNSLEPGKKPSAETLLHTQLYSWRPEIGAVLHTHSVNATVLSRLTPGDSIEFEDYELQKAFSGVSTHESRVLVPIFDNDQDIARLAAKVQPWLEAHPDCVGYLIRGHGLYTWGARMSDALRQIEAFEFCLNAN
jgi:methylthioribulose-1-phosphate dehydratase